MSTLLQLSNIHKSYDTQVVFAGVSLALGEGQRIGVIGRNGAGKSTLFKMIVGNAQPDDGEIIHYDGTRIGYLEQSDPDAGDLTVMQYLVERTRKEHWEIGKMAAKFQLKDDLLDEKVMALSGGYQMRVKITELLLHDPNLLLLDEPTNYLDLSTQLLLEAFLEDYRGTFLLISHDRECIKRTCDQTLDVYNGKLHFYPKGLEAYLAHRAQQEEFARRYNKKIARQKRHMQKFVDRFRYKDSKAKQAQSKLKAIAKLSMIDIEQPMATVRMQLPPVEKRKGEVLSAKELVIGYPDYTVASEISFSIAYGDHIAVVGDNGQGKSTLLKTLTGVIPALDGRLRWGKNLDIGYYAQDIADQLPKDLTVWQYLLQEAGRLTNEEVIREMASNFLFPEEALGKYIRVLSGGERSRLALAGLLLHRYPVLLFDEPTNHLDVETVESLAFALAESAATIIFVSHNRTFVSQLADGIIEVGGGKVKRYLHSYDDYVYHRREVLGTLTKKDEQDHEDVSQASNTVDRKALSKEQKQLKKEMEAIEYDLAHCEKNIKALHEWFTANPDIFNQKKYDQWQGLLKRKEEREQQWSELGERVEEVKRLLRGWGGERRLET